MYSTIGILKNSKKSGRLVGTHQKIDRTARRLFTRLAPKKTFFPSEKEILHFEGNRGPDGLKRKSPNVDEPMHFILPEADDGQLITMLLDHQYNLRQALKNKNSVRAAFEAAWMAHAIADGLTPAHHVPYTEMVEQLMTEKEFFKFFGEPIKGVMRGRNLLETARSNWLYLGAGGYMTKHIAFEFGIATTAAAMSYRKLTPKITKKSLKGLDFQTEFYKSLERIHQLKMYQRFCDQGWTSSLALESRNILLPEAVRAITLGWLSSLPDQDFTK